MSYHINTIWTISAAMLVFFMHGGFGFYEAGMCRSKNTVDSLSHNVIILCVELVVFWLVGFAFMFGAGSAFIGWTGFAPQLVHARAAYPSLANKAVPLAAILAFTLAYADTPATLITGTGAERIQLIAVVALTAIISGLIFPIVGHWIRGGGWLTQLKTPVYDTGSGYVHLCGGCCALVVTLVIGPRRDRFEYDEKRAFAVSSMPLVFLGAFILWLGFFAFNAGLAMMADRSVALVIVNSALAGGFGVVTAMFGSWLLTDKAELRTTIVGLLTANVAISSGPAVIMPWAAAAIGIMSGLITLGSMRFWAWLSVDDPTEYITMNVVGGILGMLAVGFFASSKITSHYPHALTPKPGLIYGHYHQMLTQLLGTAAIIIFTIAAVAIPVLTLRWMGWLRVHPQVEKEGTDRETHGETGGDEGEKENEDKDENGNGDDEREPQP